MMKSVFITAVLVAAASSASASASAFDRATAGIAASGDTVAELRCRDSAGTWLPGTLRLEDEEARQRSDRAAPAAPAVDCAVV